MSMLCLCAMNYASYPQLSFMASHIQTSYNQSGQSCVAAYRREEQQCMIATLCEICLYFAVGWLINRPANSNCIIIMLVYARVQMLMQRLEPSLVFAEHDFTGCLNLLTQAIANHDQQIPSIMSEFLGIFGEMLNARSSFSFNEFAEYYAFLVQAHSQLAKESQQFGEQMLDAAILVLSNISEEVQDMWSHPTERKNEEGAYFSEDSEIMTCKQVSDSVAQFVLQIGYKWGRVYFANIFHKYTHFGSNWREKFGALLVASMLVQEVEELSQIRGYIDEALSELHNSHPKMRYAALEVLGQIGEYVKPTFQQAYFETVVPQVLKLLYDKTPRNISHSLACLSNFFLDFRQFWKVEPILNQLLNPLLHYLKSEDLYLQQCALQVVSSLGGIRNALGASVGAIVSTCAQLLQQSLQIKSKDLMEQVFESLSVLLTHQNQQHVSVYIPHFVQSLIMNHSIISDESFFECWSKLCLNYKCFVNLESNNIVSLLLDKAGRVTKQKIEQLSLLCLQGLCSTFSAFQFALRPYVMEIYTFCKSILQNSEQNVQVKNKSIDLIVALILKTKNCDDKHNSFLTQAMDLLQFLISKGDQSIQPDGESNLLQGVLGGILSLIEPLSQALNHQLIIHISDKLMTYKQRIDELTNIQETSESMNAGECEEGKNDDSSFEDMSEEQLEMVDLFDILLLVPQIYTKILTFSSTADRQMLINILVPQIPFAVGKGDEWKPFALNLALALVEGCSFDDLQRYWADLTSLFLSFMNDSTVQLRNVSVYGAGITFQKIPVQLVNEGKVREWLEALWNSHAAPYDKDEEKSNIQHCNDNFISSLGKLLKTCGLQYPQILTRDIYQKWLQSLPLKHDEQQSIKQHQILVETLNSHPALLLNDANGLKSVFQIIADYLLLQNSSKELSSLAKTKQCLGNMTQWDIFQRSSSFIWQNLTLGQRTALSNLMSC